MCENRFYLCEHCGNLIGMVRDAGVPMMCCGQKMTKLEPNTTDAAAEKHVPVIYREGNLIRVAVGEVPHPMTEEHSILWVYLQTDKGGQRKCLEVGKECAVAFSLHNEEPIAVYAFCNLHGLWMAPYEEEKVCPLHPVNVNANENYPVCLCNNVSYFDILDAVHDCNRIEALLDVFENVKNTTKCSTGCGGCYEKVIRIISEEMNR